MSKPLQFSPHMEKTLMISASSSELLPNSEGGSQLRESSHLTKKDGYGH